MSPHKLRILLGECHQIARSHARRVGLDPNDPAVASAAGAGLALALRDHVPAKGKLTTLAYHTIRGQLTASRRNAERHQRLLPCDASDGGQPTSDHSQRLDPESRMEVRRIVRKLPPLWRKVVWLRIIGGYSLGDIARRVGCARSTAHRIFEAALDQLRCELADYA